MRRLSIIGIGACLALVGSACEGESTFEKADRIVAQQGTFAQAESVDIAATAGIEAETLAIITTPDMLTAAVVVRITSTSPEDGLLWAPIEVRLLDAAGAEVGTNNVPGADPTLIHLPSLAADASTLYVNDQIIIAGEPASAEVVVGGEPVAIAIPPSLAIANATIVEDPNLGTSWTATVTNDSGVRQEQVIVQAIVRKDGDIVATGISILPGMDPGTSAEALGFFIGDPAGGELEVVAPASNAADAAGAPPRDAQAG
jgi:hypothetical protein